MANYFELTLDTTAPANPSVSIEGGAQFTAAQLVDLTIGTSDGTTAGYQMLIWGDVETNTGEGGNANIQATEGASTWITYNTTQQVKLSAVDGVKNIYLKIRDDVHNVSSQASDSITLNTSIPTVTIVGPDVSKISKIAGKNVSAFSFTASENYQEYKVKVVGTTGAAHSTGTQIGIASGSVNMTGTNGAGFPAATPIECEITGADLEAASAGDGVKIVKVFVKDMAGNWSA
jgi:hypothetical protein